MSRLLSGFGFRFVNFRTLVCTPVSWQRQTAYSTCNGTRFLPSTSLHILYYSFLWRCKACVVDRLPLNKQWINYRACTLTRNRDILNDVWVYVILSPFFHSLSRTECFILCLLCRKCMWVCGHIIERSHLFAFLHSSPVKLLDCFN